MIARASSEEGEGCRVWEPVEELGVERPLVNNLWELRVASLAVVPQGSGAAL